MKIVIIGGSAGSKIAQDIFLLRDYQIIGFMNNYVPIENRDQLFGKVLGNYLDQSNLELLRKKSIDYFVATGDNYIRKQITDDLITLTGKTPINAIHPLSYVSNTAKIGYGCLLMPYSVINPYARVGNSVFINTQSVIEHDCVIGDYSHIASCVHLGGYVTVGSLSLLGVGSIVSSHVTVGDGSIVSEGSTVISNVDPYTMVAGVPAVLKKNLRGNIN